MRPVVVHVDVDRPREEVYDFLDVLAVHEEFTDHMLREWECSGPARGVGAKARVTAVVAGRSDSVGIEVVEAERPLRIVERNTGAGGRVSPTAHIFSGSLPAAVRGSSSSTRGGALR